MRHAQQLKVVLKKSTCQYEAVLKAGNSGKSFAGRRELSSSERTASRSSCHSTRHLAARDPRHCRSEGARFLRQVLRHRATCLKADGKDIKVLNLILSGDTYRSSIDQLAGLTEEARKLALDRIRLLQPPHSPMTDERIQQRIRDGALAKSGCNP